jgi:hypothetical protein
MLKFGTAAGIARLIVRLEMRYSTEFKPKSGVDARRSNHVTA